MSSLPASVLPLNSEQTHSLASAVSGLSPEQLQWVSGYAAGLAAANAGQPAPLLSAAPLGLSQQKLTVLYGSQTGNGEAIAESLARDAEARGFATAVTSLADYKPANLKRESLLTFVISTHGEGDPPDDAELFHEFLLSKKAPKLDGLKFAVLALGDSSYVNFCQTGREFDERLNALGAKRLVPLVECDLDYEQAASDWQANVVSVLPEPQGVSPGESARESIPQLKAVENASIFGKANPFPAEVLTNQKITGGQSSKDVRHIELSLEGSELRYEPGDSLAVVTHNPPLLVAEFIDELDLYPDTRVSVSNKELRLDDALTSQLEITALNLSFLRAWAALAGSEELDLLLTENDASALSGFLDEYQIIDVVQRYPAKVSAAEFTTMLRTLTPRSYSIASSHTANPDEVHITVAKVSYDAFSRPHWGAASSYLADRAVVGDSVSVFIERNKRFHLPAADVPIIMIGPGTGVAPFRAFVEERIEQGASGDNWLFFGDRNSDSDFLYQIEWQRYLKQGHLQHLDVAFSRDQQKKIYVQDRLREKGAEVYRWIESGAAIYVCGDAKKMALDVHDALLAILGEHGGLDTDAAEARLKTLRASQRYQRDVY